MLRRAGEYEARLKELEAERYAVEEDLAQVGRACCVSAQAPVRGFSPGRALVNKARHLDQQAVRSSTSLSLFCSC